MKRLTILLCVCLLCAAAMAQESRAKGDALPRGAIVSKVDTLRDARQSYALYLPSGYTTDRKWPILYCFDAGARGSLCVEVFKDAAERFGWIVVGSNNSRNGPFEPNEVAWKALREDTQERFAIDENRLYASGFSGGARMALHNALTSRQPFAGVLPCAAGYGSEARPEPGSKIVICGMAGTEDPNLSELQGVVADLRDKHMRARLLVFPGPHNWAPRDVCTKAVRFAELASLFDRGLGAGPEATALLREEIADSEELIKNEDTLYAGFVRRRELVEDFKASPLCEPVGKWAQKAVMSEPLKSEVAAQEAMKAMREDLARLYERLDNEKAQKTLQVYQEFVDAHRGTAASEKLSGAVRNMTLAFYGQKGVAFLRQKQYAKAVEALEAGVRFVPDDVGIAYNLACAQALAGAKDKALKALAAAVEKGYVDVEHMEKDEDLVSLRGEPEFKAIVEQARAQSAPGLEKK